VTEWYAFSDHCPVIATFEDWEQPSMNDEEQVPEAGIPAAALVEAGETPVEKLEALGVRGILWQLARDGQLIDVRCEMPQCYCFRGRSYFEPGSTLSEWSPTADHYPLLGKRMSLDEIAEKLNAEKVPTIHGTNRWTAASVRKAFVS
jgi:hypothetical protein